MINLTNNCIEGFKDKNLIVADFVMLADNKDMFRILKDNNTEGPFKMTLFEGRAEDLAATKYDDEILCDLPVTWFKPYGNLLVLYVDTN